MKITHKIVAGLIATGIACSGTSVASAQSSDLFGSLSSSSAASPIESEQQSDEARLKRATEGYGERAGLTLSAKSEAIATEYANKAANGEITIYGDSHSIWESRGIGTITVIPRAVAEIAIDMYETTTNTAPYELRVGVSVSSDADNFYLVEFYGG